MPVTLTPAERAKRDGAKVTIHLSFSEADALSFDLSDLLCWHRGYAAAMGGNTENAPMGVEAACKLNLKLKEAMRRAGDE